MNKKIIIRHTRHSDIGPIINLQQRVYPTIPPWREELMLKQIETFPQGQMVAESD
ncbi:MAG: hypothetical protein HQL49_05850 [Gammaproteobacteria bacterium]|nr:hypothetical protein [Gammaproteobacteria bacterium]